MITPEPIPEGLTERSLNTAFTTEEWPEWDEADLVPDVAAEDDATDTIDDDGLALDDPVDADTAPATTEPDSDPAPETDPEMPDSADPTDSFDGTADTDDTDDMDDMALDDYEDLDVDSDF